MSEEAILTLLEKNELSIASLYEVFREKFSGTREFWGSLVVEEKAHASVIKSLKLAWLKKQAAFNFSRFNTTGLRTFADYMDKLISSARSESMTEIKALTAARDLEHSLIEHNFFDVLNPVSGKMIMEFAELKRHTKEHAGKIVGVLERVQRNSAVS